MTPELQRYLLQVKKKGYNAQEIQGKLIKAGYNREQIGKAMEWLKTQGTAGKVTSPAEYKELLSTEKKAVEAKKRKRDIGQPWFIRNYYRHFTRTHYSYAAGVQDIRRPHPWHIAWVADFQIRKQVLNYSHQLAQTLGYQLTPRKDCTYSQERKAPRIKIFGLAYRLVKNDAIESSTTREKISS